MRAAGLALCGSTGRSLGPAFPHAWPEVAADLESRADEPCGKSVPSSIFKTLLLMECAGEVPLEKQLNRDPADGWGTAQFVRPTVFNAMPELEDGELPDDGAPLGPGGGGAEKGATWNLCTECHGAGPGESHRVLVSLR